MKLIQKKLHILRNGTLDYGFAAYANAWVPGDEKNNRKYLNPLLTSAVLYFSPPAEICRMAVWQKKRKMTDGAPLVLAGIAIGDMAGEPYEGCGCGDRSGQVIPLVQERAHITDDTILACAVMDAALSIRNDAKNGKLSSKNISCVARYERWIKKYAKKYPDAGYGGTFYRWAVHDEAEAGYKSYGNGGAMRSGVIGALFNSVDDVICQAVMSALPTHSHPEGIKGAVVTAVAVFLALHHIGKEHILKYMESYYTGLDFDGEPYRIRTDTDINMMARAKLPYLYASVRTQETIPEVIINLRNSNGYESCIRNVFRYICDSDTVGAISGGIAAALYPEELRRVCKQVQPCEGVYEMLTEKILNELLNERKKEG